MSLFDTHAHLDFPFLRDQIEDVLARAKEVGVEKIVTIGASKGLKSNVDAVTIAEEFENVWCSIGIHPLDAGSSDIDVYNEVEKRFSGHEKVVAIGETGLDYFYDRAPRDKQIMLFRKQLQLSKKLNKPVIIHARDADEDTIKILKEEGVTQGILHCFTGSQWMAEELLKPELDFYISFSGIVTFKNGKELLDIATNLVPLNRILVETDSPYLAPTPHRGKKNEPAFVYHTASMIAESRKLDFENFSKYTYENAHRVFNLEL